MKLNVTKNNVTITEDSILNKGEYKANQCQFTFSEDYQNLIKRAMFFVLDKQIEVPIDSSGNCYVPPEAVKYGAINIFIGVYAYQADGDDLILVYSPTPVKKFVEQGSYVEDPDNSGPLTPTFMQEVLALIGDIDEALDIINGEEL